MSAVTVMQEVFTARGIGPDKVNHSLGTAPPPSSSGPAFEEFTARVIEGDIWQRKELSPRDRSLVTIACCMAQGTLGELPAQLKRGVRNGLREVELLEAVAHLAFYIGWPRANAVRDMVYAAAKA
jgi:4-carboxymuconolactone decarboxylase